MHKLHSTPSCASETAKHVLGKVGHPVHHNIATVQDTSTMERHTPRIGTDFRFAQHAVRAD
jgi:hypothetical protein